MFLQQDIAWEDPPEDPKGDSSSSISDNLVNVPSAQEEKYSADSRVWDVNKTVMEGKNFKESPYDICYIHNAYIGMYYLPYVPYLMPTYVVVAQAGWISVARVSSCLSGHIDGVY